MSFAHVLGGALMGVGAGIADKAKIEAAGAQAKAADDRQMALEALRTQNAQAQTTLEYDLRDRNDARGTSRQTASTIAIDKGRGAIELTQLAAKQAFDAFLVEKKAQLDMGSDTNRAQLQAQMNDLDAARDKVHSVQVASDGNMVAVLTDGTTKNLGFAAMPKAPVGGAAGGSILQAAGAGAASAAPQSKPLKVVTMREVTAEAKRLGMTPDELTRYLVGTGEVKVTK